MHFSRGYFDSLCALGSVFSVRIADIDDDVWISSRQSSGEAMGAALSSTNGRLSWYWIVSIKWVSSEKKNQITIFYFGEGNWFGVFFHEWKNTEINFLSHNFTKFFTRM